MKNSIEITHSDKIIFLKEKISKLDLINYYNDISKHIMPFLEKRLISVVRCHSSDLNKKFFKKHPQNFENVERVKLKKNEADYFYLKDNFQLLSQVQFGTIEFHMYLYKISSKTPDIMIFDLDPDENLPIEKLRQGVKILKKFLDKLNLKSYLKTSGGKGYHVCVPFKSVSSFKKLNSFAKSVAQALEKTYPDLFVSTISKQKRENRIFIDYMRNSKNSTCVAPFSIRCRKSAPISMPISWKNLDNVLPNEITIKNYREYFKTNYWKNFFKVEQSLE